MVLALSPHLDDAVFSVGALLAQLVGRGEAVTIATVFTASVAGPDGFALACQTDKGFGAEVDYMALRRAEDVEACRIIGAEVEHWGFAEAPHRGYPSAAALFTGIREGGEEAGVVSQIAERLTQVLTKVQISSVLYPICAGNHVDHLVVSRAVDILKEAWPNVRWLQWYDQPYVARRRGDYGYLASAKPVGTLAAVGAEAALFEWGGGAHDVALERKWRACAAYVSQVGYQFYGALGETRPQDADDVARAAVVIGQREWLEGSVVSARLMKH